MRIVFKNVRPVLGLFFSLVFLFSGVSAFAQTDQTTEAAADTATAPTDLAPALEPSFEALFGDAAEQDREVLGRVEALVSEGKWKSAWTTLSEADPENINPFLLAEKIRLALDGHAQTTMHLLYGFVDLAEGENLEMLRFGAPDTGDPIEFNPAQITDSLEERGEAIPPALSLKMGDYYHTVWQNYQGQWLLSDEEVLVKGVENYDRALAYDLFTADSLDRQSGMLLALQRFEGAEKILVKALELSPDSNALTLRLAEVYLSSGRLEEVYPLADKIIAGAADDYELNDGYIVAIRAGLSALDQEKLTKYIDGLESSFPGESTPGLIRHLVAVQLGDSPAADAAADKVTQAFAGDPEVVRSLLSTWLSANDPDSGFRYLDRAIAKAGGDDAMASFYFYRAILHGEVAMSADELRLGLLDLSAAKTYFSKSYPEDHEIFAILEEIKVKWEQAVNPPEQDAEAEQDSAAMEASPAPETETAPGPEAVAPQQESPSTQE
ncbi:MAG: tetratricopeptide repeat protein [Spirochaetales bacterium]|nr:tetratricopeptide repeat protein [Spirochaetales bacterium]